MAKAVQIAEKSLSMGSGKKRGGAPKLSREQRADIKRRLLAGERVVALADEYHVTPEAIYPMRKKLGIRGRVRVKVSQPIETPPAPKVAAVKWDNSHRGNLALQMLRFKRGELRPESAVVVIRRYRAMLQYDLDKAQAQIKAIKREIVPIDEALHELDVIQQGEKAAVEKVLAAVK
jgi:hypothetical protein